MTINKDTALERLHHIPAKCFMQFRKHLLRLFGSSIDQIANATTYYHKNKTNMNHLSTKW